MMIKEYTLPILALALGAYVSATAMAQDKSPLQQLIEANNQKLITIGEAGGIEPAANDRLLNEHQQKFANWSLQAISPHVIVRAGEYSVYSFIRTDDGLIAVDAGWFVNQTGPAFAQAQEQTGLSKVNAIIYTHTHTDHTNGTNALLKNVDDPSTLPVYGPRGWDRNLKYESGPLTSMFLRRGLSQIGVLLPRGLVGTVNSGLGGPITMGVMQEGLAVNHEITEHRESHSIGGLDFEFLNTPGDLADNMAVYLKQDKVLFIGDILDGTFLPLMSARWEPGRTIVGYRDTLIRLLENFPDAEHLVSGHGVVTSGREAVRVRLQNARDLAIFTEDYMNRAARLGWSPDEVIDNFKLPTRLAEDPNLQAFYHRLDWILRGAYVMKTGWVTDINSLTRWTDSVEIPRLVKLMGGRDRVYAEALAAYEHDDPRWAITLTSYLLEVNKADEPVRDLQEQSLLKVAYSTMSANERHYALSDVLDLPWTTLIAPMLREKYAHLNAEQVMSMLTLLVNHTQALEDRLFLNFQINGDDTYSFRLVEGIVQVSVGRDSKATTTLAMDRQTLDKIAAGLLPLGQAISDNKVTVAGDAESAIRLADLIQT